MKNSNKVTFILFLMLFSLAIIAHGENVNKIPEAVNSSFNTKYPNINVKKWKCQHGLYTAKLTLDKHISYATFDAKGNWINTISKVRWTWNLPKIVNDAYKKSTYRSWNVYFIKKVERPSGIYYQLMVDNSNFTEIASSEGKFATDKLIEFKSDGLLTMDKDITDDPVP